MNQPSSLSGSLVETVPPGRVSTDRLHFRSRRVLGVLVTGMACALVTAWLAMENARLGKPQWVSGFTLLATLFLLVLLGMRKRLPGLRLGSVSTWTQVHLYSGLFAGVVYVLHAPALLGDGVLEFWVSVTFGMVFISGVYGWYASRTIPKRLTSSMHNFRFDRSAWHRNGLQQTAGKLLDKLPESDSEQLLRSHYDRHLESYFSRRRSLRFMLWPNAKDHRRKIAHLMELKRYLDPEGRTVVGQLSALIRQRDAVDYQQALQFRLRAWVVFHSVLSVLLLGGGIAHAVIAIRFLGGD